MTDSSPPPAERHDPEETIPSKAFHAVERWLLVIAAVIILKTRVAPDSFTDG